MMPFGDPSSVQPDFSRNLRSWSVQSKQVKVGFFLILQPFDEDNFLAL